LKWAMWEIGKQKSDQQPQHNYLSLREEFYITTLVSWF
jgi:acyl-CoA-binding protein